VELNGYTWVIDPLDGTTNFQNRIPFFCTAIGVLRNGLPHIGAVYDPVANEVYYAIDGSQAKLWSISRGEVSAIAADQTTNELSGCLAGTHISSRPEVAERLLQKDLLLNIEKKVKHLRAFGCGQLALAYVASARMQLFFQFDSHLWDQVAGIVLVRNSKGGSVSKLPDGRGASEVLGENWTFSTRDFIAAANPRVQSEFLKLLT
jgi:myo-inositol-1(or 4)-monophosphatase